MTYKHRHQNRYHGRYTFTGDYTALKVMLSSVVFCWVVLNLNWVKLIPQMYALPEWNSPISDAKVIEVPVVQNVSIDVLKIVDAVEVLESSAGKNTNPNALHNICKAKGQANTWGYGGMAMSKCFPNHEQGRAWITYWWAKTLQATNNNISMSACIYNTGHKTSDCEYARDLTALLNK
jgi:hypothetical protein